ncbi:hypothetical protein GOV07_05560 [Candidatus Woesearchaeota archaeon]|nr:hypothetical protein [Candidatus Woesearchaeota archaeon]
MIKKGRGKQAFDWKLWLPRGIVILYICFLSLFALDVFSEGYGFLELLVALFMHLLPSLVLVGVLILAWKRPKWGGITFLVLGLIFTVFFNTYEDLINFLIISLPLFITGGLFVWSGKTS